AVAERRAVGEGAGEVDVVGELAGVLGVGVDDAPRPGQVRHALGRHEHGVLALPGEVDGVLGLAVEPEDAPMALEVARRHALGVLVEEAEEVDLDVLPRPRRRAGVGGEALEEAVVEALRVGGGGVLVAVGGPADLADDDGHVAVADALERRHQRVEVGVEHVGVGDAVVHHRRRAAVEEGEVDGEVVVEVEADERVDVDGERRAVVGQELHHLRHQVGDVGAEPPRRRHLLVLRRVVYVGVERHGGLDAVAEAGVVQRVLDVHQRRQRHLVERAIVCRQERLVPDGDVPAQEPHTSHITTPRAAAP
ncbi:Os03g0792850, partial [Oryza sativa Japonica Group]